MWWQMRSQARMRACRGARRDGQRPRARVGPRAGEALLVRDTFECELWSAPAVLGAGAALQGLLPEASLVRRATYRRAPAPRQPRHPPRLRASTFDVASFPSCRASRVDARHPLATTTGFSVKEGFHAAIHAETPVLHLTRQRAKR